MAMSRIFPGFLYSKSLRSEDSLEEGYKTWFSNAKLDNLRDRIEALRTSFRWRPDSSRRYPPVMVFEAGEGERILVVRFSDAGKDPFGRPQTLRMEAFLVPVDLASLFWGGTFTAEPDSDHAAFVVNGISPTTDFPGWNQDRLVQGESGTFSLGTPSPCRLSHVATSTDHFNPKDVQEPPFPEPTLNPPQKQQPTSESMRTIRELTVDHSRKERKIMSKVLFTLLIVLCVFGVWNYFQSADEIECLRKNLEARESEVKGYRSEISNLRGENERLKVKINKFDNWVKTRSNFERNKVQLKIKFGEIIQDFREVEDLLSHIDEVHKPSYGAGMHAVPSSTPDVNSRTNNSFQAAIYMPRREGDRRVDAETESSRLREPKRGDNKKKESWLEKVNPF